MDVHVRELPLANGAVALVSAEDYLRVCRIKWCEQGGGYVRGRWSKRAGGSGQVVYLHRFILAAPKGYVVDHIDGNTLNNTRRNLQITTQSRNSMRSRGNGSVTRLWNFPNRWRVRMRIDGEMTSLGCFDTEDEARRALAEVRQVVWNDPAFNPLGTVF